jgi:AcrR family transcriptional regulator
MAVKNEIILDRRVRKTKKALTEALMSLMVEKGYEKVTIQHIIEKADVGRSTFYIHYENKEQLLLDGHNNLNVAIFSETVDANGNEITFESLFEHIAAQQLLAKAMLGKKDGEMMLEFFKHTIAYHIKKRFGKYFGKEVDEQKSLVFLSDASASAVVSLIISWIEDEMSFSVQEMAAKCREVIRAIFEKSIP